jgi:uncharacterized lipoprotein YajG
MFPKIGNSIWVLLLLIIAGCSRPGATPPGSNTAAVPFTAPSGNALNPNSTELSAAVARIVAGAHRSGSVIYRVQCGPERTLQESRVVPSQPAIEPLQQALEQLTRANPGLKWQDSDGGIRVLDSSVTGGLLKVRIAEFTVVEDRGADTALAALWRTPEVIRYMAAHDLRFAHSSAGTQARASRGVVVIHMRNASVEEIVQRIAANYTTSTGRFWSYRECQRGAETLVEIKIL